MLIAKCKLFRVERTYLFMYIITKMCNKPIYREINFLKAASTLDFTKKKIYKNDCALRERKKRRKQ